MLPKYTLTNPAIIINLGDVHLGDYNHDLTTFSKVVKYIADVPHCYWVSTGDLLNVALKDSLTSVYKSDPPATEMEKLFTILKPITPKCLGIVGSNHHKRFERAVGVNLDKLICDKLNIPYIGISGVICVVVNNSVYYVAMHHGRGGGRTRGGKANSLEELAKLYPGCDLYLEGHTHTFTYFINEHFYIDRKRNNMVRYNAHFCTTTSFLLWKDGYGEEKKYPPTPPGAARIILTGNGGGRFVDKKIYCDLFNGVG